VITLKKEDVLENFKKWMKENTNLKQNSIVQYTLQIKKFFDKFDEVSLKNLRAFLFMKRDKKSSEEARIVYHRRFAVKKFLMFLGKEDWVKELDKLKKELRLQDRRHERYIDFETFKEMIEGFSGELRLIMMVLYDTGMRISPVINLKVRKVREDEKGTYIEGREKGGKLVKRYVDAQTAEMLKEMLKNKHSNDYVFRKKVGKRWETWWECYYRLWKELKVESRKFLGDFGISFHWVRTSRAKELYRKYRDLIKVKRFLGHKSITTTARYIDEGEFESSDIIKEEKGKWS
jgi:integrase/recombinase XerD